MSGQGRQGVGLKIVLGDPAHRVAQYLPHIRSFAGRISRQLVHQPVRIVSTNSSGSFSLCISRPRRRWSYATGINSNESARRNASKEDHTSVRPSVAGAGFDCGEGGGDTGVGVSAGVGVPTAAGGAAVSPQIVIIARNNRNVFGPEDLN